MAAGRVLPMRLEHDAAGAIAVYGLRYRCFAPHEGLHPTLGSQAPLRLRLRHPEQTEDQLVSLHEWHPDGGAYDGLPSSLEAARVRRAERVTVKTVPRESAASAVDAPAPGPGRYAMDLRWLGGHVPV